MRNSWPLVLVLAGCPDKTETPTDSTTPPTDSTTLCAAGVASTFPEDGATGVYYRTSVAFVLQEADPTASIAVEDEAGTVVPGASTVAGATVTWAGDPLAPSAAYDAVLTDACGTVRITFRTGSTGEPAPDVTGDTYELDLQSGRWIEPPDFGDVLPSLAAAYGLLVSVTEVTDSSLSMFAAVTKEGVQNTCALTVPLVDASYDNPYFELTSAAFPVSLPADTMYITDFVVAGAFAPGGTSMDGVTVRGMIDTRPLALMLLGTDEACGTLSAFGVTCKACPDGSGDYCVAVDVEDVTADRVDAAVVEITDLDPSCGS